jgi:proton-dependent oligopeptide transporter, POT family
LKLGATAGSSTSFKVVLFLEEYMSQRGQEETLFGHPVGLFTLFFAEMWERFSYYGMRSLLVFYMIKGFLGLNDGQAYGVYGAYTALVYATPFIGGIVADKLLGQRHAVILGGALMAAGHLLMGVESSTPFYLALGLLIVGNGFFKPNISTMVGSLYPPGSDRRDAGFTLFYMGINLGAAMSPLVCGYIGEKYGWHYGFNLATIGMIIGLLIFIAPRQVNMVTISLGALGTAATLLYIAEPGPFRIVNGIIAVAIIIAAVIAVMALSRGGLPDWAGLQPPEAKEKGMAAIAPVYLCTAIAVPIISMLLQRDSWAGYVLTLFGGIALIWLIYQIVTRPKIQRERLQVVLVLMFFSMLFWAFFEQAGSSVTNFTDRNIDRVEEERVLTQEDVGKPLLLKLNQGQTGYQIPGFEVFTIDELDAVRTGDIALQLTQQDVGMAITELVKGQDDIEREVTQDDVGKTVKVKLNDKLLGYQLPGMAPLDKESLELLAKGELNIEVTDGMVGMPIGGIETPASIFQSANPTFILIFGLVFSTLWTFLASRNIEPNIAVKFSLGLAQLGLGFGAFYIGAQQASEQGMVWMGWLLLGYLLHTTGELCISPVGLSMVTKLSPTDIVSTVMGSWFLALAFSNYLAAVIAKFTGVSHGGESGSNTIPPPVDTLQIYQSVFLKICVASLVGALICFVLSFFLVKWMHEDEPTA